MKTKLIIFGITGDLSTRKLLPALSKIITAGTFDDLQVIGVSRKKIDMSEFLQSLPGEINLGKNASLFSMDLAAKADYEELKKSINLQKNEQAVVYLSVPPSASSQIVTLLGEAGLNTPNVKLLFEKPFGVDLESAKDMILHTSRYFEEEQIYRIDHYLAKEMAQNIIAFRSHNALFSQIWNHEFIERIEILASETIGIEGRVVFYEQTGALKDFLQGHLMQLLALTIMEIPDQLDWNAVPALRLEALRSVRLADPTTAIRAQYDSYQEEVNNSGSTTETFVSVQLASSNSRWNNVPLTLTTGKALDRKTTEVRIYFKKQHDKQSDELIFHIQPDEGVEIGLYTKKPGYEREFEEQKLSFTYAEDALLPDAYEQVLVDAIRSSKSLFTSGEEVLRSWEILQPILDTWSMSTERLPLYSKGEATHNICSVEKKI